MTTAVVLADAEGTDRLDGLVPDPLAADEARRLSRAMLADVCAAVQRGGADLLVNTTPGSESAARDLLDDALPDPGAARYEPQVGGDRAARAGNALTHLLTEEGESTVAVVEPTAPLLRREHLGTLAMKLRSRDAVFGPAPDGRVTVAGFREPLDFADVYEPPALETFTRRARAADLDVGFLSMTPVVERPGDLATALPVLSARRAAGRLVPPRTTALVEEWGLAVGPDGGVTREG